MRGRPGSGGGRVARLQPAVAVVAALAVGAVVALALAGAPPDVGGTAAPPDGDGVTVTGNTTVRISYAVDGHERTTVVRGVDPRYSDGERGWAVLERAALPPGLLDGRAGVVTVGPYALVGNHTNATVSLPDGPLTVVAPAGLVDPARKAGFLEQFLAPYDLRPGPSRPATLVAVPAALPARGKTYGTTGYVAATYFWDGDAGSVWLHETVHTRGTLALDPRMRWFREASAQYLAFRIMEEQYGAVTDADVRARLDAFDRYPNATLADPASWGGEPVDYRRGARLLSAVDAWLRAATGGRRSLVDVFRATNGREAPLTVDAFVRIVERQAGRDAGWLRAAITEPGPIEAALPAVDLDRVIGLPTVLVPETRGTP